MAVSHEPVEARIWYKQSNDASKEESASLPPERRQDEPKGERETRFLQYNE